MDNRNDTNIKPFEKWRKQFLETKCCWYLFICMQTESSEKQY